MTHNGTISIYWFEWIPNRILQWKYRSYAGRTRSMHIYGVSRFKSCWQNWGTVLNIRIETRKLPWHWRSFSDEKPIVGCRKPLLLLWSTSVGLISSQSNSSSSVFCHDVVITLPIPFLSGRSTSKGSLPEVSWLLSLL